MGSSRRVASAGLIWAHLIYEFRKALSMFKQPENHKTRGMAFGYLSGNQERGASRAGQYIAT